MEIYKLSSKPSDDSGAGGSSDGSNNGFGGGSDNFGAVLKITALKQAVKNPERVNVFVNGKYSFSLDVTQLLDVKLKVGRVISETELIELKKLSEFGKLYQKTLEWVLMRPRSEKETADYLYRKLRMSSSKASARLQGVRLSAESTYSSGDVSNISEQIIGRLRAKKYLDDVAFAKWYVENRFVKKGVSKRRLGFELAKKGVSREIISQVLEESGRDEKDEILKMIAKKRVKYDDDRLIQYLCRQGFSYELVCNLVLGYGKG